MEKSDLPREYIELATRFFQALEALKQRDDIRGIGTFIRKHGIDKRNFYKVKDFSIRFKPEWLVYLARDYKVSSEWLLTGRGEMFTKQPLT
jgi:hypothetical protein